MAAASAAVLDRYLRRRRAWEVGFWCAFWLMQATANSVTVNLDIARVGLGFAAWEPVVWEFSSCLMLLALIPAVLAFDRRYPLRFDTWRRHLPLHIVASLVYSLVHVLGMVALRQLAYAAAGGDYDFGNWPLEFFYEYLKDARTYAVTLALVYGYRALLLRLQGEVRLLAAPDVGPAVEPVERPERFLVRKLGREFLIAADDIEWLEAAENYVNLHLRGRAYPLRSTMAAIESRLDPARFRRVHRSYIVNLDHLAEIQPLDGGEALLKLRDGTLVPCSRRYRPALRAAA